MHTFCFRFDIDTHKCIRDGVPVLLDLSKRHKVKFTFFLNTGRAVDRKSFLINLFSRKIKSDQIFNLSAFSKLGLLDYLYITILNPLIGRNYENNIKSIITNKHELSLHGGKNHQQWADLLPHWSIKKIESEVIWGLNEIKKISPETKVIGFASPAWNGSKNLHAVLTKLNFSYLADVHSDNSLQSIKKEGKLKFIPTNILGEPGGVGYIEYCRAKGMNTEQILKDFKNKLLVRKKLAIMYDHPFYAGVKESFILDEMIKIVKSMNYKISTFSEL